MDEAQVQSYVENLAGKYNTIYVPRSFQTTGGGVIEVSNNEYGYRIDQSGEVQQILTDLKRAEKPLPVSLFMRRLVCHEMEPMI